MALMVSNEMIVKDVIANFALEGMFFTEDEIILLKECASGKRNISKEIKKIIIGENK